MSVSAGSTPGVLCLTIDNIGEAAQLGAGTWPPDVPIGEHFTVGVIERILGRLSDYGLVATFFVEAFNTVIYPGLLREIVSAGHEIACHAWQHENWGSLSEEYEREILARSTAALRELDLDPVGLRPPGGLVTEGTSELLAEFGYRYQSPAGSRPGVADGIAVIPFRWQLVDAFFYAPSFGGLRERHGASAEPLPTALLVDELIDAIDAGASSGDQTTLLFHPMLLSEADRFQAFEDVLRHARELTDAGRAEVLRMRDFADRMLSAPDPYGPPVLDTATWA